VEKDDNPWRGGRRKTNFCLEVGEVCLEGLGCQKEDYKIRKKKIGGFLPGKSALNREYYYTRTERKWGSLGNRGDSTSTQGFQWKGAKKSKGRASLTFDKMCGRNHPETEKVLGGGG